MLRPSNIFFASSLAGVASFLMMAGVVACSSSSDGGSSSGGTSGTSGTSGSSGSSGSSGTSGTSGSSGTSGTSGTSGSSGSSGTSGVDSGGDSAAVVVNGCNTFVDRSAAGASRTITWDFPVSAAPERCMTIKKGQDVTFSGDFTIHPLVASGGGAGNPLGSPDATGKVSFVQAGTFGFVCGNHPAMTGAIRVSE